jgi:hypothetical protein
VKDARELLAAGATLALDACAVELDAQLREHGVEPIVLRGPTIAGLLYADAPRSYDDVDLLVSEHDLAAVERTLRAVGFELTSRDVHAAPWIRPSDGMNLDVHTTLVGVGAPPSDVWRELARYRRPLRLARGAVDGLAPPAVALGVALHAAQHGIDGKKALEDLARAIERLSNVDWSEAAALAERLEASPAFATGLRLLPVGDRLAEELGLPQAGSRELALRAGSAPPTALGFWRLAETPGAGAKARLLAHELAPSAAFMRAMYPLARRGPIGLAFAYVWRPLMLAAQVGPGFRAWRRARRHS